MPICLSPLRSPVGSTGVPNSGSNGQLALNLLTQELTNFKAQVSTCGSDVCGTLRLNSYHLRLIRHERPCVQGIRCIEPRRARAQDEATCGDPCWQRNLE